MAVAASRGELTVEVVAASEVAWFDAQLAERHYLGAGRPVGDYLRQVVRVRGAPAASPPGQSVIVSDVPR